ncbi:hypothetical protein C8Q76DRAFT_634496 [Earliella scabrosa]|nr:hypothetical protein C8Q76DRAFT_634496 [Earliella scabrosa]
MPDADTDTTPWYCSVPDVTHPADARVAAEVDDRLITSPNQDWVPALPCGSNVMKVYTDGLWGLHEYSRWPQRLLANMLHVPCIPTPRAVPTQLQILWASLNPHHDWVELQSDGLVGRGYLAVPIQDRLIYAAHRAIERFHSLDHVPPRRLAFGQELILVLRQCIERMRRWPALPTVAIALGAHIQRVTLELMGLETYFNIVLPRADSGEDFSNDILPVVGVFVTSLSSAMTCTRIGLPTWLVRPFTPEIRIWQVVPCTQPHHLQTSHGTTLNSHGPHAMAGILNAAQNDWLADMVFVVSRQLCAVHAPTLPTMDDPPGAPRKLRVITKSLAVPVRPEPHETSQAASRASRPALSRLRPELTTASRSCIDTRPSLHHPSRQFTLSPFYNIPPAWQRALERAGTLDQPEHSAQYFYPPPFLLDTISTRSFKVPRYIHNLVRIREFCRLRLLELTWSGRPLSIAEWRVALWGDYEAKAHPVIRGSEGEQRRAKRKHNERNAIGRLFGEGACLPSYTLSDAPTLGDQVVTAEVAARDRRVRNALLWEAHEISWRCELMALDRALLPRDDWPVVDVWARDSQISAVWGLDSAAMGVVPDISTEPAQFGWKSTTDGDWSACIPFLRAFLDVICRWPNRPPYLVGALRNQSWDADEYSLIQEVAANFYTQTFVAKFHRLPIVPIACIDQFS